MSILGCAQPTVHGSGFAPISIRVNPSEALDGQGLICLPCLLATLTDPLVTGIRKLSILQGIEVSRLQHFANMTGKSLGILNSSYQVT